jgi:tetratricopeptide (TPR) repeat protein
MLKRYEGRKCWFSESSRRCSGARCAKVRNVRRHEWVFFALLLIVSNCIGCRREALPESSSPEYTAALRAFYVGLSALQVGDDVRAEAKLKETTQLAPDEPAAWANLGLLYLRQREFDRAAENLERARQLAPDNNQIYVLLGLLESNRGRYGEAIAALRRAVELNPKDLKALYALASEIEREAAEAGEAETTRLLEKILEAAPDNLAVQLDLARLSAKRGDASVLRRMVERLAEKAPSWPTEVQEQFKALQVAASSENVRAAAPRVQFLRNVLVRIPEYRQSLAAVKLPAEVVGEPLVRPIRLETPPSQPAPPDENLSFTTEPLPEANEGQWTSASAVSLTGEGPPALVLQSSAALKIGNGPALKFAESKGAAATPARMVAFDFDYDFKSDILLVNGGGLRLYKQEAGGVFADVTARTALPAQVLNAAYNGAWAVDIEADGDLDLVLAVSGREPLVLQNNGDGTFREARVFAGAAPLRDFAWADIDGDGDTDAALLGEQGQLRVFSNERGGQFRERAVPSQSADNVAAISAADVNRDGTLDLLLVKSDGAVERLSDKLEGSEWDGSELARWTNVPGRLEAGSVHLFACDLDNNGGLDLLASSETHGATRVWLSDAEGGFKPLASPLDAGLDSVVDLNNDGRLDLIGRAGGRPARFLNKGTKAYHWQVVRTRAQNATGDQRINSFGIGGEIEIRAGLLVQKQPITSPMLHFGLGQQTGTDVARIIWPNGVLQAEFELKGDQVALAEQRLKGSCPWVFAYDGKQVRFVTDTLWRSPLGLKINAQDTAGVMMTEEWVKIRGDQLAPREGFYDVRITAELWESHFFDHVSLMVFDHPAETEVNVDERFAVPPPALKVYPTSRPRAFAVALDDGGNDVSTVVGETDGRYLDNFGRGRYQGITREHFVEVELPENAPRDSPLWLVASGWIHPTDSSINVAVSQGEQPKPQGLSLEVADGSGGWTTALPALGFPAGKNKTVLLELTNVFRGGAPRRLRLRTNLEIYWDKLAWAAGLPQTELRTKRIMPGAAELRFRGYSAVSQADQSSPELPDYNRLAGTVPRWRDLVGYHTRFGDVGELLREVDDRYVIMNAGDEMLFRFPAEPPPPAGWVRDFVLVCDGWEKDGDYNTTFSKTVLPLPTHENADYSKQSPRLEDDTVYRRHPQDWQDYHTRYVTPRSLFEALRLK